MFETHSHLRRQITRTVCGAGALAYLIAWVAPSWAWQTAHGKPDNTSFEDVLTTGAVQPLSGARRLGGVAVGAGPVVAPDGTVYVGNSRGKLMSFAPDGTPGWSRDISGGQAILSSPALGNDGSIYVIGMATVRDNTMNPPQQTHVAELHKFSPGGGYLWHVPLSGAIGGLSPGAPPNIWRNGNTDVVMVPTIRKFGGGFETHLLAIADSGALLADQQVTIFSPTTTGGFGEPLWHLSCYFMTLGLLCPTFDPPPEPAGDAPYALPQKTLRPFPAVAIFISATPGTQPMVMVTDGARDLVGYAFTGDAFIEKFREHDDLVQILSTPLAWPDGHAMISTATSASSGGVLLAGFGMTTIRGEGPYSFAAPTQLGRGNFVIVHRYGGISVMRGANVMASQKLSGESVVPAAASRTHFFVSTVDGLHSFDTAKFAEVAMFDWENGGASPPVIGPQGHVYAIADDRLFVFPPPLAIPAVTGNTTGNTTTATPAQENFGAPLTANGNRLYACEKLDGDDCGKGDYRAIAQAFCQTQGYASASAFDIDSKKVKAETLDGRFCTKNKCKVFEGIACAK